MKAEPESTMDTGSPFVKTPLDGLRVLVTRPEELAGGLVRQLRALGAEPIVCPTIRFVPPASYAPLDAALRQVQSYDWIIFTSVNGVRFFFERLATLGIEPGSLAGARLAAIGPATARGLEERGVAPDLVPARYIAEAILDEIGQVAGQRILLPRADIARKALADGLRARGAIVDEVAAYCTVAAGGTLPPGPFDWVTFTSASTVHNLAGLAEAAGQNLSEYLAGARIACIGPITAQAVRAGGLTVDLEAAEYSMEGLIAALVERTNHSTEQTL